MKLSQGVEWGLHCVVLLAQDPDGAPVSRRTLAQQFGLPETYLAKHLQALVRAGILSATSGPKGGFRLAAPPEEITALDVLEAVEGTASPFVCQEIRRRGEGGLPPEECRAPCTISSVMSTAHEAWRASLREVTVAGIRESLPPGVRDRGIAGVSTPGTPGGDGAAGA